MNNSSSKPSEQPALELPSAHPQVTAGGVCPFGHVAKSALSEQTPVEDSADANAAPPAGVCPFGHK